MATFTSAQAGELMRMMNLNVTPQHWNKSQITAALQAIEDRMMSAGTRTTIANDIEAVAAGVFSGTQKEMLFAIWSVTYAMRQGIIER